MQKMWNGGCLYKTDTGWKGPAQERCRPRRNFFSERSGPAEPVKNHEKMKIMDQQEGRKKISAPCCSGSG